MTVAATAASLFVVAQAVAQVGPNGEVDGLSAKFFDVNGVRTRAYDYGTGEAVVMVHGGAIGGASTANNFARNIPGLSERFRVLAVDKLSAGLTDNPQDDGDLNVQGQVDHMYQFIRMLDVGPVHLVGHSSGGAVAFYLATQHPEVVKTLTILTVGPSMPRLGERRTKFQSLVEECPPPPGYDYWHCRLRVLGHVPETFPDEFMAADQWMADQPKSLETRSRLDALRAAGNPGPTYRDLNPAAFEKARAGVLTMPIMIYGGKQDTLDWFADDPHSMMEAELHFFDIVGAQNPRVKFVILNEAGHFPYREHPEQFNADLMHFIDFWNANPTASSGAER
jgi:pimeloyl-ACP methyl ester carboxylesterase